MKRVDELCPDTQRVIREFQQNLPLKIGALCEKLGINAYLSELPDGISGQIVKDEDEACGYSIFVNAFETHHRQNFTTAHELAHYLLHKEHIGDGIVDNPLYCSRLSNALEVEANQLAADILMPYDKIEEKINANKKHITINDLARQFGVSESAMKVRLGIPS